MQSCSYPIGELLPHRPPMVLLDEVLSWEQGRIKVALTIRPGIPFYYDDKGVPSYVGLEYMAQTCGAYAGLEGIKAQQPIKLGFLLGTRKYHSVKGWFAPHTKLIINAEELIRQDFMGVFDCRILANDIELASAQLNVYQPEDVDHFLNKTGT